MRAFLAVAAVGLVAALVSCNPEGEPDDLFFLDGRLVDQSSAVRPNAAFTLNRFSHSNGYGCPDSLREGVNPYFGEYGPGGNFIPYADGGLYAPYRDLETDGTGRFIVELMRFELAPPRQQGNQGMCLALTASGAGGAQSVAWSFNGVADQRYPDLPVWEGVALAQDLGPQGPQIPAPGLPWEPSPPDGGPQWEPLFFNSFAVRGSGTYYEFEVDQGGQPSWRQRTFGEAMPVGPELLEDFGSPSVSMEAMFAFVDQGPPPFTVQSVYEWSARTASSPLAMGGAVPRSRGAPCSTGGQPIANCPLTDGLLDLVDINGLVDPGGGPGPGPGPGAGLAWSFDLTTPALPRLALIRDLQSYGTDPAIAVEGSVDGGAGTWRQIGLSLGEVSDGGEPRMFGPPTGSYPLMANGRYLRIALDAGSVPMRYVRINAGEMSFLSGVREVSIFE